MSNDGRFGILRKILQTLGLSSQSADDVVNFIVDLLASNKNTADVAPRAEFPYRVRDHFLSPAELDFYRVLVGVVGSRAVLCTKVALGDIFWVTQNDASQFRIYTNKIDRKHVDFLLCDTNTLQPLVGIELDDKSHARPDRQERDAFVNQVFASAGLPLLHVPVKRTYSVAELTQQLAPYWVSSSLPLSVSNLKSVPTPIIATTNSTPQCPKCGSPMVLRTTKSGANAGNQFWGCSTYPTCRTMLPYQP